jgi:hypothetical protein
MIVFFAPGGRLGNVMFQVSFIESIRRPGERVLATQLKGLSRLFAGIGPYREWNSWFANNLVDHLLRPLFVQALCRARLVTWIRETDSGILWNRGIFPIRFVEGYFQDPALAKVSLSLKETGEGWKEILKEAGNRIPVFLHIRRSDYLGWTVLGNVKPLLPVSYYRRAIEMWFGDRDRWHFIVLGDSSEWAAEQFGDLPHRSISRLGPIEDLLIMKACAGGICSNSTFAWWGARMCSGAAPVIGPRWWLGWSIKTWYPRGIETPWMTYLEVSNP